MAIVYLCSILNFVHKKLDLSKKISNGGVGVWRRGGVMVVVGYHDNPIEILV